MTQPAPQRSVNAETVTDIYETLIRAVAVRDEGLDHSPLPESLAGTVATEMYLPLWLWEQGEKPTRTEPVLRLYTGHIEESERTELRCLLVGLDVFIAMLDEFIDSDCSSGQYRLSLAINIAFGSLLSFGSIPREHRSDVVELLLAYFVEIARIPMVETATTDALEATESTAEQNELIRFAYGYRARDISVFGRLPSLLCDIDDSTVEDIVHDLQMYRARYLLFDDLRDVCEDSRNNIQTPGLWLLAEHDDSEALRDRLAEIYESFEYADNTHRQALLELECVPSNAHSEIDAAKAALAGQSAPELNPDAEITRT